MEVGVRELRNNLSKYLDRVRDGEEIMVTDRGRAIARVLPTGAERVLDRLIAEGVVTPAQRPKRRSTNPIKSEGTVSDLVVVASDKDVLTAAVSQGMAVAEVS